MGLFHKSLIFGVYRRLCWEYIFCNGWCGLYKRRKHGRGNQNGQSRKTGTVGYIKNPTLCAGHHNRETNTNDVYKKWTLLQTTGGKDEPNIVCMHGIAMRASLLI